MEPTALAPPAPAGFAQMSGAYWMESDSPIYDTVKRLWLQQGREVPRQPGPSERTPVGIADLFERA
ncbi:hypothetical protein [Streptomyces sp. NBC_01358]|uniref:hypothetical protein n=1 Tax=Streptomyces sp. NBC_01358 TaxID=2903837 RepID=UPI002E3191D7|nr:hypothetical protein [Streptomyces sp. NBC_01358]